MIQNKMRFVKTVIFSRNVPLKRKLNDYFFKTLKISYQLSSVSLKNNYVRETFLNNHININVKINFLNHLDDLSRV